MAIRQLLGKEGTSTPKGPGPRQMSDHATVEVEFGEGKRMVELRNRNPYSSWAASNEKYTHD